MTERSIPAQMSVLNPEDGKLLSQVRAGGICFQNGDPRFFSRNEADQQSVINELCNFCPVKKPCLDFAIRTFADGVWGGTTPEERIQLRRSITTPKRSRRRL